MRDCVREWATLWPVLNDTGVARSSWLMVESCLNLNLHLATSAQQCGFCPIRETHPPCVAFGCTNISRSCLLAPMFHERCATLQMQHRAGLVVLVWVVVAFLVPSIAVMLEKRPWQRTLHGHTLVWHGAWFTGLALWWIWGRHDAYPAPLPPKEICVAALPGAVWITTVFPSVRKDPMVHAYSVILMLFAYWVLFVYRAAISSSPCTEWLNAPLFATLACVWHLWDATTSVPGATLIQDVRFPWTTEHAGSHQICGAVTLAAMTASLLVEPDTTATLALFGVTVTIAATRVSVPFVCRNTDTTLRTVLWVQFVLLALDAVGAKLGGWWWRKYLREIICGNVCGAAGITMWAVDKHRNRRRCSCALKAQRRATQDATKLPSVVVHMIEEYSASAQH